MLYHYDISNQQDAAKFVLLILLSLLYMFRVTVSPVIRSTLTVYTVWNNVPTLLSAADRSATDSRVGTLFQKAVYTVFFYFFKDLLHRKSVTYTGLQNYEIVPLTNLP